MTERTARLPVALRRIPEFFIQTLKSRLLTPLRSVLFPTDSPHYMDVTLHGCQEKSTPADTVCRSGSGIIIVYSPLVLISGT